MDHGHQGEQPKILHIQFLPIALGHKDAHTVVVWEQTQRHPHWFPKPVLACEQEARSSSLRERGGSLPPYAVVRTPREATDGGA